jgi:hypothetical protein
VAPPPQRSSSSSYSRKGQEATKSRGKVYARVPEEEASPLQQVRGKSAKERRKSLQRAKSISTPDDEVQLQVEVHEASRHQIASDGDDTLNNMRVPSLERDEEAGVEVVVEVSD